MHGRDVRIGLEPFASFRRANVSRLFGQIDSNARRVSCMNINVDLLADDGDSRKEEGECHVSIA